MLKVMVKLLQQIQVELIKGNIIDVFLNSESECRTWGRKYNVPVYILAYPGEW